MSRTNWRLALAGLTVTLFLSPAIRGEDEIEAIAKGVANPELRGAGRPASELPYRRGHLTLEPSTGSVYAVFAGGRLGGLFFSGSAKVRYRSEDPLEAANFRTNVSRVSSYKLDGGAFEETVSSALVWDPAAAREVFPDAQELKPEDVPGAARQALAAFVERFENDQNLAYVVLVTQALLESPEQPFVLARFWGASHDLVYLHDTLRWYDESIYVPYKPPETTRFVKGARFLEVLSEQPIGRQRLDPRPIPFVVRHVDLTLVNPESRRAQLEVRETIEMKRSRRSLAFDLWNVRFNYVRDPGGPARAVYEIKSITDAQGRQLPFVHDRNEVLVQLPEPAQPGASLELTFSVEGDILFRPDGDNYWVLMISPWLPVPERDDMQAFTYHAVLKAPRPFLPFSNGRTVRRWEEGDGAMLCAEFELDRPMQYPVAIAGKYDVQHQTNDGITVEVASYAAAKPAAKKQIANNILALAEAYKPLLGELPFDEIKVIEINDYGFGVAPAGVIFITKEAFEPGVMSRGWSEGLNQRFAHELAHMWWGHVAKMSGPEEQWLSESTSEYYAAFVLSKLWRESVMKEALREWRSQAAFVKDSGSLLLANQLGGEKGFEDRYALLYAKGPLVLHALREELGDDRIFFTIFKSYLRSYPFKHVHTKDFIGITKWITKKDYGPWFERYLLGAEWPPGTLEAGKKKKKKR